MSWFPSPEIVSFPGPPMKVTERFELLVSVSFPDPPMIVIEGIVELTDAPIVTLSLESSDVDDHRTGERADRAAVELRAAGRAAARPVTPPVGSSMSRFPPATETVTWFTSPKDAM